MPTGFTSNIAFIGTEKNPRLKLPSAINEIFGYEQDFITNAGSSILTFSSTQAPNVSPDNSVLIICDQVFNEFSNLGTLYAISPSDKLYNLLRGKFGEDKSPFRKKVANWLKQQEINQIYTPSRGKT